MIADLQEILPKAFNELSSDEKRLLVLALGSVNAPEYPHLDTSGGILVIRINTKDFAAGGTFPADSDRENLSLTASRLMSRRICFRESDPQIEVTMRWIIGAYCDHDEGWIELQLHPWVIEHIPIIRGLLSG
jgi:hypothetical protein